MNDDLTLIDCGDGRKVHITPPSVHRLVAETIARLEEERDVAVKVARNEIGWRKRAEARAERLEEALRELKHRWYLGDLQEKDFTAALEEALALTQKGAAEPTEYERKVAQMKKDFPNGI